MKKTIVILSLIFCLSSCTQRGCQSLQRGLQFTERYYRVTLYSGGKPVQVWEFKGIINQEEQSDGVYWFQDGELIEVSGDYVVESLGSHKPETMTFGQQAKDTATYKNVFDYNNR